MHHKFLCLENSDSIFLIFVKRPKLPLHILRIKKNIICQNWNLRFHFMMSLVAMAKFNSRIHAILSKFGRNSIPMLPLFVKRPKIPWISFLINKTLDRSYFCQTPCQICLSWFSWIYYKKISLSCWYDSPQRSLLIWITCEMWWKTIKKWYLS